MSTKNFGEDLSIRLQDHLTAQTTKTNHITNKTFFYFSTKLSGKCQSYVTKQFCSYLAKIADFLLISVL